MKKYTNQEIEAIEHGISTLVEQRKIIARVIFKERQKLYNHRKYLRRKLQK
jgi:hypothetical protein